jgi:hypothetical protein
MYKFSRKKLSNELRYSEASGFRGEGGQILPCAQNDSQNRL